MKADVYQKVTNKIIADLEANGLPPLGGPVQVLVHDGVWCQGGRRRGRSHVPL